MKRLFLISLILSLTIHIIIIVIFSVVLPNKQHKQHHLKYHPVYSVDIINLPKKEQKINTHKYKHKIAANINRAGHAKIYSIHEKIPMKMTTKIPKKVASTVHILNKKQKSKAKEKLAALQRSKMQGLSESRHKKNIIARKSYKNKSIIKLNRGLFNNGVLGNKNINGFTGGTSVGLNRGLFNNGVLGNKNINGFTGGTSKEYAYKHASREATVSIGTQSIKCASYMKHIKDKVQNVWVYPQGARENGIQGRLLIYFSIAKDGSLYRLSLVRSSGSKILDDAAMQAIRNAAPFPKLPDRFQLNRLNIYATFEYKLVNYYIE